MQEVNIGSTSPTPTPYVLVVQNGNTSELSRKAALVSLVLVSLQRTVHKIKYLIGPSPDLARKNDLRLEARDMELQLQGLLER